MSPPARAAGPSPSSRRSLSPDPRGPRSSHPPQLRGVPREPRGLCACRWRWGLLGGVDEGACAVAAAWLWRSGLAGGARLGGACAPLALSRLWCPAELPGPPVAGGGGCRVGGLSGGGLGAVRPHPPRATSGSPRRRARARPAPLSPPPPTSLPPFLQVPSAFRRGGLKTPGGTACPPRGRGGGPAGGPGGSRPACPPPDSAPPCPVEAGALRSPSRRAASRGGCRRERGT